jgi:hypothetical protein
MVLFAVLAVLLPWSLYRQMHEHAVTPQGLIKLPLIFIAIGALGWTAQDNPTDAAAAGYMAVSLGLSVALGVWRGAVIPAWRNEDGTWMSKGNRLTITLWIALIAAKFAMGTVASITGLLPVTGTSEVFLFLGISFAVQNLVVARRTLGGKPARQLATA